MSICSRKFNLHSLVQQFLPSAAAITVFLAAGGEAIASSETFTIEVGLSGYLRYEDVMRQVEQLASTEIFRRFNTNDGLSELQIVVLGQRNGEVVPILSAQVSRQQWIASPQVSNWAQYYNSSYALLHFADDESSTNESQTSPSPQPIVTAYQDPSDQVEAAFREGRLTREEYEELIHALD